MKDEYVNIYDRYGRSLGARNDWQIIPDAFDYIIFKDGGIIKAKNGMTGKIEFKGTDTKDILERIMGELTEGGLIYLKAGNYTTADITTPLQLSYGVGLIGITPEKTVLNFPIQLSEYFNTLINLKVKNPNADKTGTGILGKQGGYHYFDRVFIEGWETGMKVSTTGSWGNSTLLDVEAYNCRMAYGSNNYTFYLHVGTMKAVNCDYFGAFTFCDSVVSHLNLLNVSGGYSTTYPSSISANRSWIGVMFVEDNSWVELSRGGYGGFNRSTIERLLIQTGSTVRFGKVVIPSYVNYLQMASDATLETWTDNIFIRAPNGIEGIFRVRAGNPKIFGVSNSGIATITGDGTTTSFTVDVQHELNVDDPSKIAVIITPSKNADVSYEFVDTDTDGFAETLRITLNFTTAPASGTVVYISWSAHVVYT